MEKPNDRKRAALYVRVSTDGQSVENQLRELRAVARRHSWKIVETFSDRGISGAKGRNGRPGFNTLCSGIARRDFDLVAAWSVDRLGRSLQDLVGFLEELGAKGIDLYLHRQGLDTSTPSGRAMFGMLSVFSEFERAMIRERVVAGLERAKGRGKRLGRPPVSAKIERAVREARAAGKSIHAIRRQLGIGTGTVQRILAE